MADVDKEIYVEANYQSEATTGKKQKREGKLRSKVWEHFTKLIKEDGTCDKCQCNHCQKLFTCSSRIGTTHLLGHVSDGICPVFKQEKKYKSSAPLNYTRTNGVSVPWKYNPGPAQQPADVVVELLPEGLTDLKHQAVKEIQVDNGVQKQTPSSGKLPQQSAVKSHPKVEPLMNELRACLAKLAEFTDVSIPMGSLTAAPVCAPDYSIAAALKRLNEMVDIPQSSEMYLDTFEILQDECERECFICLPPEPRRRWMQRMLHQRHPLSYSSSILQCSWWLVVALFAAGWCIILKILYFLNKNCGEGSAVENIWLWWLVVALFAAGWCIILKILYFLNKNCGEGLCGVHLALADVVYDYNRRKKNCIEVSSKL